MPDIVGVHQTLSRPIGSMLRISSRDHILDIASLIASDHGASRITIDAVAKRAGVSKGGVMYHFNSKDELLAALVDRVTQITLSRLAESEIRYANQAFPELHALICDGLRDDPSERALMAGLLGAVANNPSLGKPAADTYHKVYQRLGSLSAVAPNAVVIALALDGLLFLRLLNLMEFDAHSLNHIRSSLEKLAADPTKKPALRRTLKRTPLKAAKIKKN